MILAALGLVSTSANPQTIRIWGPPTMAGIAQRWAEAYRQVHPEVAFELVMKGSDVAVPGLYSGKADIALMGRENDEVDDNGFSRPMGYPLARIAITSGSLATPGKSDAIAVLVPKGNPLSGLTVAELGRVMDCGTDARLRPLRTWGDLGLNGRWADKPIHVYAYDMGSRTGRFVQHVATGDRRRMCWDRLKEYADARRLDGTIESAAERIGASARQDPYALAIANEAQASEGLKLVAISRSASEQFVLPSASSIADGSYPLARRTYAFFKHKPGSKIDPKVISFLRFVLGRTGQSLLAEDRGYLPLDPKSAAQSNAALETQ
jgi:phosphate transport system substrate-binding protein